MCCRQPPSTRSYLMVTTKMIPVIFFRGFSSIATKHNSSIIIIGPRRPNIFFGMIAALRASRITRGSRALTTLVIPVAPLSRAMCHFDHLTDLFDMESMTLWYECVGVECVIRVDSMEDVLKPSGGLTLTDKGVWSFSFRIGHGNLRWSDYFGFI